MKTEIAAFLLFGAIAGCAPSNVSPGMTFAAGLSSYHEEMERLAGTPERWPDRQRLAESIKSTYTVTLGGSKEFNRLVDLDLRRREFLITLREQSVNADRSREMKQELLQIEEQVDGLKKIVKGQITRLELSQPAQAQRVENVATIGLLNLAIDSFAVSQSNISAPSTSRVGSYTVINEGSFSTVQTPDGQIFRCFTKMVPDAGVSIKCDPAGGKS